MLNDDWSRVEALSRFLPAPRAILALAVAALLGLTAGCDQSPGASEVEATATYRVEGSTSSTTVWYVGADQAVNVERVSLPWSLEVPAGNDHVLFVRTSRDLDAPSVRVSIDRGAGTARTAVAARTVTTAGLLRSPADSVHVRYGVDGTYRAVDTLRQTIEGPEGPVSHTFVKADGFPPNYYPTDEDLLEPDTTVTVATPFTPALRLQAAPVATDAIALTATIHARPDGFDEPLLLRRAVLEAGRPALDLTAARIETDQRLE